MPIKIPGFARLPTWRAAVAAMFLALLPATALAQDGRWALIFAVSDYSDPTIEDLANTVNDGRTMASVLQQMGFDIYYAEDYDRARFDELVDRIVAEQGESDLGLFYFAGHGVQVSGQNYALPADIRPRDSGFLSESAISIGEVISRLRATNVENLVVILDACRNSPFTNATAIGTGLALVDAPDNTIIAYSTAPGELALDGAGANSPYTTALANALESERTDIRDALRLVRAQVRLATRGAQTPWFIDNSRGEMVIAPDAPTAQTVGLPVLEEGEISLAATAWWTIANSADRRDFETYLALFPDAEQAASAERQLTLLGGTPEFPLMELGLPLDDPEVPGGLNSAITACDILATSTDGYMSLVEAVPHDLVNIRTATRACTQAVRNDPLNPRLLELLAWVLYLDDRFPEALHYYRLATERGNARAWGGIAQIYRLGLGVEIDIERSAQAIRAGALGGSTDMRVAMGIYYREGWGVPRSFNEARRWFELGVLAGSVSAMSALGDMYRRGQLGEPNPARAVELYRMAAALEQSDAMNNLGMAYMRGDGVATDHRLGIAWLSQASEMGNPYAAFHLGRAFLTGWGVDPDPDQALAFFRLSAQRNFLSAYTYIGNAILAGENPDRAEAMANYIIAIEAGALKNTSESLEDAQEARDRLDELLPQMSAAEQAEGQRIAEDWIAQYGLLDFTLVHQ